MPSPAWRSRVKNSPSTAAFDLDNEPESAQLPDGQTIYRSRNRGALYFSAWAVHSRAGDHGPVQQREYDRRNQDERLSEVHAGYQNRTKDHAHHGEKISRRQLEHSSAPSGCLRRRIGRAAQPTP